MHLHTPRGGLKYMYLSQRERGECTPFFQSFLCLQINLLSGTLSATPAWHHGRIMALPCKWETARELRRQCAYEHACAFTHASVLLVFIRGWKGGRPSGSAAVWGKFGTSPVIGKPSQIQSTFDHPPVGNLARLVWETIRTGWKT